MTLQQRLATAEQMLEQEIEKRRAEGTEDSFAGRLGIASFRHHVDELKRLANREQEAPFTEVLEVRVSGSRFSFGSAPLESLSEFTAEIRRIFGYTCLRIIEGSQKKRVPSHIYSGLNLRLSALEAGSTKLIIAADSEKQLFEDSLAREASQRLMHVFGSEPDGPEFLESVTDIGPLAARRLKKLTFAMVEMDLGLSIQWISRGTVSGGYSQNKNRLARLAQALNSTTFTEEVETSVQGIIELLSARSRIHLRSADGKLLRITYPQRLLSEISTLSIGQQIKARVLMSSVTYKLTGETETLFELIKVERSPAQ